MTVNVTPLDLPEFKAVVSSPDGGAPLLLLTGSGDIEESNHLGVVLRALHTELVRVGASEVAVDFRQLEFMNSSCFKEFVSWLASLQDLEPAKQYRIRFLSSPNKHWQKRSLGALGCFAADLVSVEM